jgi:hypothetical protein
MCPVMGPRAWNGGYAKKSPVKEFSYLEQWPIFIVSWVQDDKR